jgi:hypothetical protein
LHCNSDLQLVWTIGFRMAKLPWEFYTLSKNSKIEWPRDKMDSLLSLRLLRLDGWQIWPKQLHIWTLTPYFILETLSLFLYDPPKFQNPPYGNFLGFLKFKNPIFPISIEVGLFTYKVSYQKVRWNEVSIFCHLSLFFYIFISGSSGTVSLKYLFKNIQKILRFLF